MTGHPRQDRVDARANRDRGALVSEFIENVAQ